jgi:hypothetical protein
MASICSTTKKSINRFCKCKIAPSARQHASQTQKPGLSRVPLTAAATLKVRRFNNKSFSKPIIGKIDAKLAKLIQQLLRNNKLHITSLIDLILIRLLIQSNAKTRPRSAKA